MNSPQNRNERLEHLLIDQATVGLDRHQERELAELMAGDSAGGTEHENAYMETAALVQLGMLQLDAAAPVPVDVMSPELRARILATAPQTVQPAPVADMAAHRERRMATEQPARSFGLRDAGWAVAAALAVALVIVQPDADSADDASGTGSAAAMAAAIDAAPDSVAVPWSGPRQSGYENVSGEIVWSDSAQAGYMRLTGMPANDARQSQYQLWIIDPERSAQPVDGGVFDVPAGRSEVIIPVTAKLAVDDPTLFAITLEQPGGVVVSAGPLLIQADPAQASI